MTHATPPTATPGSHRTTFAKSFTQQEPLPEAAIDAAVAVMRSGRLHRYNTGEGEVAQAALLETEFARWLGVPYCLACASGGYAIHIALRTLALAPGAPVLCNGWTLSPVPGAIVNAGASVVLVETGADLTIDCDDLARAAGETGARVLVLSHMRGHIGDMDRIVELCARHGIRLVEDCAHTMGARWKGRASGTFGEVACFSTQTYKHVNSGEGGLLVTANEALMRRAVVLSGSYMFYDRHQAAPPAEGYADVRLDTPNLSGRIDNLRAAILRPQLAGLEASCERWNHRYRLLEGGLRRIDAVRIVERPEHEQFVGSSIQFLLPGLDAARIARFVAIAARRGVPVKWFGADEPAGYTSRYDSWRYLGDSRPLPATRALLSRLCDIRIPLTFDDADCACITAVIAESLVDSFADAPADAPAASPATSPAGAAPARPSGQDGRQPV
ncbi:MAG: DegT/DnrJ/EryC1/StrS family aminotransferase [Lautropia sp.]